MNTSNLLYNNTDKIINAIINEQRYKDDIADIEGNNDFIFIYNTVRKWICREIHDTLTEDFHYKHDTWDYRNITYYYDKIFTENDNIQIRNFISINYKEIHEKLLDSIAYQRHKNYMNTYQKCKNRLFEKLNNKQKYTISQARSLLSENNKLPITEDDFRRLYDIFVEEWNKRQESETPQRHILRDTFTDKLNDFVVFNHERLLNKDEFARVSQNWGQTSLSLDEWYDRYVNKFYYQPTTHTTYTIPEEQNYIGFKSENKIRALQRIFPGKKVNIYEHTSYFPLKSNKKYQLHKVSSRYSYIIDLMFVDKLCYLVMINVNTRYLYVELVNQILFDNDSENSEKRQRFAKYEKSADNYLKTLDKIIKSGVIIKHLTFDGEGSFNSRKAQNYYNSHGIHWRTAPRMKMGNYPDFMKREQKQTKTDPMHSSLGLIDRVIRTLRDMAYNMRVGIITPSIMNELVRQYNNAPHKTLSKYAGKSVSPKQVNDDKELESYIVMNICKENYNIMMSDGFYLNKGMSVKLYNEKDGMMKRRTNVQPGKYKVIGFANGLYRVVDEKNNIQSIPRFKLDT